MAQLGIRPRCDSWMTGHAPAFTRVLAQHGWVGMNVPGRYGGHERGAYERYVVNEELLALGAPVAAHWFADRQVAPSLLRHGTEAQRERYLPGIVSGEHFFSIGMSEPDSGSDLAAVRTRALRDSDGWRISGAKAWTSHAHRAHSILLLARTDPAEPSRHIGLSQFVVDLDVEGVQVRPIITMDSEHHFNDVIFTDARVDGDALLGRRGDGWGQVMAELGYERSGPERFLSTMPLLRSLVRRRAAPEDELGEIVADLRALRVLSARVARSLDEGEFPGVEGALVKDLGTRFEQRVVDLARTHAGVRPDPSSEDDLARLLGEALLHGPDRTLRGGTNEVLRSIIAREVVAQ